ncbi:THAP domain-containing protein 5, partial [Galemys pyrenaicus]
LTKTCKGGFHTSLEIPNSTVITLTTSNSEGIQQSLEIQEVLENTTNHLANPNFTNNSMEINSQTAQTVEKINTNIEPVIAIFVPTESSKPK